MDLLTSLLYGIIQGLTEFLPVSSSGHLAIFRAVTGSDPGSFVAYEVLLHLGTLAAVLLLYRRDVWGILRGFFSLLRKVCKGQARWKQLSSYEKLVCMILIATLPLVAGALLDHFLEVLTGTVAVVGGILLLNGLLLLWSDRLAKKGNLRLLADASPKDALLVGLCQLCAVLPGLSRSGATITGGLWRGFTREEAVRFSFLMSIPAIAGACVLKLPELFSGGVESGMWPVYLAGAAAAFTVGLLAMGLLRAIARKGSFRGFAIYCFCIGAAVLVYRLVC